MAGRCCVSTGWGAGIDTDEARRRGFEAVLAKPFQPAELLRTIVGAAAG